MTLRIRNRIILLLLFTSIIIALFISGLYIYAFLKNAIIAPVMPIRQFHFPTLSIFALRYNFPCSLIGSAVFLFYSLFFLFWIFVRFEKTQSPEIFYFCLFLCSTLCESFKLLVPLFALWQTFYRQTYSFRKVSCSHLHLNVFTFLNRNSNARL